MYVFEISPRRRWLISAIMKFLLCYRKSRSFLLLLCLFSFGEYSYAAADTIYVEAATQILVAPEKNNGARLSLTLTDDLNHPLPGESLSVYLRHDDRIQRFDAQTDASGNVIIDTALPDGSYPGSATFMGRNGRLPATVDFQFNVQKCRLKTSLIPSQSGAFSVDDTITLTIQREKNICTDLGVQYFLEIGESSFEPKLRPGQTELQIDIPPHTFLPGTYEIQLTPHTEDNFMAEDISVPLFIYDTLFEKNAYLSEDWRGAHLVVALSSDIPDAFARKISTQLQWMHLPTDISSHDDLLSIAAHLSDFINIKRYRKETKAGTRLPLAFDIDFSERSLSHTACIFAQIDRIDGSDNDRIAQKLCLPPKRPFSENILWVLGIVTFLSIIYLLYARFYPILKRKYYKRPKAPNTQHTTPEILQNLHDIDVIFPPSMTSNRCTCIFVDEKTGNIIRSAQISCTIHQQTSTASIPLSLPLHTTVEIAHPDYMIWRGKINHPGNYKIKLKSKRDYIIDCYRYVCRQYISDDDTWGKISPKMLCSQTENHPRLQTQEARARLYAFCHSFEALAYGARHMTEDDLNHIYQQSRDI